MQDEFVSNRLTRAEVKDCAYARLCRKGNIISFAILGVYSTIFLAVYFILRYVDKDPKAYVVLCVCLFFASFFIGFIVYNCVNLHKLYANYENWELVTCKISYQFTVHSAPKLFGNKANIIASSFTFTTVDGNIHNIGPRKVKNFALIAVLRLDRYNGEAQCLYDAKNHVLYPFSQLPPKSKKA